MASSSMASSKYLCKNLQFSVELLVNAMDEEEVRIILEDKLQFKTIFLCYPVNATKSSRAYHRGEAITIAMRRLIAQAVEDRMINLKLSERPGVSTTLNISLQEEEFPTGSSTEQDA
jgi:hypothetical protein